MKTKPQAQDATPLLQNLQGSLHFASGQLFWQSYEESPTIKPVSIEAARQAFSNQPIDSGWIPPGVLRWGHGNKGQWMVEWIAPATYTITLEMAGERKTISVPMPSLIWFGQGKHFYIWAAKQKTFRPDAPLFHAPLPNVGDSGVICFGNQNPHRVEKGGFDAAWNLFWEMAFNKDHANGKSRAHEKDVTRQLLAVAKAKAKTYPLNDLLPMNWTLGQIVNKFAKR